MIRFQSWPFQHNPRGYDTYRLCQEGEGPIRDEAQNAHEQEHFHGATSGTDAICTIGVLLMDKNPGIK